MNRKTIKKVLNKKFNKWLDSIEDEKVRRLVKKNSIITGGAIANMLLNEPVKDFDVYFMDKETTLAVAKYYVDKFNKAKDTVEAQVLHVDNKDEHTDECDRDSYLKRAMDTIVGDPGRVMVYVRSRGVAAADGYELNEPSEDVVELVEESDSIPERVLECGDGSEKPRFRPIFLSSNAITLSEKVQIVIRFYGNPEEIHENYDFVHCMNYWTSGDDNLVLKPEAMESLLTKNLVYCGSRYPLCSVIRTRKFIKRGFHINAGQYLKMMFQISQLDLTDIEVLEDQLVGVDSAYFNMLITALRSKQEAEKNRRVEEQYLATLIDKIF